MSEQLLQQILEKLNQVDNRISSLEASQKDIAEGQKRIEFRLESLENDVKDIKEDIRAVRIETSRAFTEAVNPTISKVENIELDVKMLKRIVTN